VDPVVRIGLTCTTCVGQAQNGTPSTETLPPSFRLTSVRTNRPCLGLQSITP